MTVTITDNDAEKVCFEDDADDMAVCQQIPLTVGENTIKVKVTAGDSVTTRTYTVGVTRSPAPELVVSPSELEIDEAGSDTFTVKLTASPIAAVTVSVRSDDVGRRTYLLPTSPLLQAVGTTPRP